MTHLTHNVAQTERVAGRLARSLRGGECITLQGELGAGKTQFVRGLVSALGGDPRAVSSPTFVLLNIYDTPTFKVFHLDVYRVHGSEDFESVGFSELLEQPNAIVCVEWPSKVEEALASIRSSRIDVTIESVGLHEREITIEQDATLQNLTPLARALQQVDAKEQPMPRGDKSSYSSKQKRQAEHIEEGYEKRGVPKKEAERRAWATENKMSGGGKKSGSGRGKKTNKGPAKKGGKKGGRASANRPKAARSASAKKAARTRKRRGS